MNNNATTLKILQYNVWKSKDKVMAPLLRDRAILDYDVIAIQEPWVNPFEHNSHNPISSSFVLWLPPPGDKPRVAFYTNKRINHSRVTFTAHSSDFATISIAAREDPDLDPDFFDAIDNSTTHIHNVYNHPPDDAPTRTLQQLEATLKEHRLRSKGQDQQVVVGDFNMEAPEWAAEDLGDRGTARRGLPYFRQLLVTESLEVVLPKGTVTWEGRDSKSTIDLSLCNLRARERLVECRRVDALNHDSDHWPIHTILRTQLPQAPEGTPVKLWKRTPVEEFNEKLQGRLPKLKGRLSNEDVLKAFQDIVKALEDTIKDTVPTTKPATWHTPGFTGECKEAVQETQRLRRVWQRERTEEAWEAYRVARNQKGNLIQRTLRDTHRERVEEAVTKGPQGLWKLAKWARDRGTGVAKQRVTPTIEGQDTHEGKVAALSKVFFPVPPSIAEPSPQVPPCSTDLPCPPLSKEEVRQALLRPRPHKAPGPSGIPNFILRISSKLLMPLLHPLFNYCFFRGICPFKDSTTVVLKKPGKDDYGKAKSYRPIALLETISKIIESAIAERMSYYVETYKLLSEDHIGARKTRSTEHAIHRLLERIYKAHGAADTGEFLVATLLMLDASGAFDNVHHGKLIECLARRGLPQQVVRWISVWLEGRRTRLRLPEGESKWIHLRYGIPQGSSLSPILWLFYNADLLDEILKGVVVRDSGSDGNGGDGGTTELPCNYPVGEISTTAWVDDTGILVIGKSAADNCRVLERVHGNAADWATRYGCVFAPEKYEVIHFDTSMMARIRSAATLHTPPLKECLQLPGVAPKAPTGRLRHLGVWFDPALLWDHHIEAVTTKVSKSIQALKAISGSTWGCGTLLLRQLYQGIIVPQITYCSSVWHQPHVRALRVGVTKRQLAKLSDLQKRALLVVTGGIQYTAGSALTTEMHVLPIDQQLLKTNHMAYLRLATNPITQPDPNVAPTRRKAQWKSPLTKLNEHHAQYHATQPPIETIVPYVVPPWWRPASVTITGDEKSGKAHHEKVTRQGKTNRSLICYTDGSGYKDGVGASAYAPKQATISMSRQRTASLGPLTQSTVYLAELMGIHMALGMAQSHRGTLHRVDIFTDNQAAITSAAAPLRQSGQWLLTEIARQIEDLRQRQTTTHIHWIPAHTGVRGNETADKLAKAAAEKALERAANSDNRTTLYTTTASQRMLAKKLAKTRWDAAWDADNSGRVLYQYQRAPSKGTLPKYKGLKRALAAALFQMRTGKIGLNDYLWHINRADSPLCSCGGGRQTARHVLIDCEDYQDLRWEVWNTRNSGWKANRPLTDIRKIWDHPQRARTAAIFMLRTGLLGQFSYAVSKGAADDPEDSEDDRRDT